MGNIRHQESMLFNNFFQANGISRSSDTFICSLYDEFLLIYEIAKVGTPVASTHLKLEVRFHDMRGNVYVYQNGAFGNLIEGRGTGADTSIPCKKSFRGRCIGTEISVKITADGALTTTNYYTASVRMQFMGRE